MAFSSFVRQSLFPFGTSHNDTLATLWELIMAKSAFDHCRNWLLRLFTGPTLAAML